MAELTRKQLWQISSGSRAIMSHMESVTDWWLGRLGATPVGASGSTP